MTDREMELMKSILDSNNNLVRINEELVNVNNGWRDLVVKLLHELAEAKGVKI